MKSNMKPIIKSKRNKRKATALNMAIMLLYQMITMVVGFVVPRLLLSTYGVEIHGYTSTVSTIMSYIALLNAGLATAAIQSLYAPLAENDHKELSAVLNAINKFYVKTGVSYTAAVISCAVALPFVIAGDIPDSILFLLMLTMGASNTLECFVYSKYRVLLQADQRLYIVTIGDMIALTIRGVLQVILIQNRASIIIVTLVPLCMVFLRMLVVSIYIKKNYPYLDRNIPSKDSALSKRWSAFIHQIAALAVNNTDILILTLRGSLTLVSIYSVYNLVCSHINSLLSMLFSQSALASFGLMIHENNKEKLVTVYRTFEYIYFMIITVVFSITAVLLLPFVTLYTASVSYIQYADATLVFLFIAIGIVNNMRIPCVTMIIAAGKFKETQARAMIEAIINLVVSLVLVHFIGMYGLLIGTILSFSYRTTDIVLYTNKYILETSSKDSFIRMMRLILTVLFNVFLLSRMVDSSSISSWGQWVITGAFVTFIVCVVSAGINFILEPKEMKTSVDYVKRILDRKN